MVNCRRYERPNAFVKTVAATSQRQCLCLLLVETASSYGYQISLKLRHIAQPHIKI
jgi:hypothetical protein